MATKDPLKRKLHDIKHKYGQGAVLYFIKNPTCERCLEARLVTLSIHHVKGKSIDEFETLCFNCHMLLHSTRSGEATFKSCMSKEEGRREVRKEKLKAKTELAISLIAEGEPLRSIRQKVGGTYLFVKRIAESQGYEVSPRRGYSLPCQPVLK